MGWGVNVWGNRLSSAASAGRLSGRTSRLLTALLICLVLLAGSGRSQPTDEIYIISNSAPKSVEATAVSRDGNYLVTAETRAVRVWDMRTNRLVTAFSGQRGQVINVAISPDNKTLAASVVATDDRDRVDLILLHLDSGRRDRIDTGNVFAFFDFSPDGSYLIGDGAAWDLKSRRRGGFDTLSNSLQADVHRAQELGCRNFRELETGDCTGHIAADSATDEPGTQLLQPDITKRPPPPQSSVRTGIGTFLDPFRTMAAASSSPRVAVATASKIVIWDMVEAIPLRTLPAPNMRLARISNDGHLLIVSDGFALEVWDVDTGLRRARMGSDVEISALAITSDAGHLVTGHRDGSIRQWGKSLTEPSSFSRPEELVRHDREVRVAQFSPNDQILATASVDGAVWLHALSPAGPVTVLGGRGAPVPANAMAFSMDGNRLLLARGSYGQLWDIDRNVLIEEYGDPQLKAVRNIGSIGFYADETRVFTAFGNGDIYGWKVGLATSDSLAEMDMLIGSRSDWSIVRPSHDNRRLISAGPDGALAVWAPLEGTTGRQRALAAELWHGEGDAWVAMTVEGFFKGSLAGARDLVSIVRKSRATGIDQVFQSLYAPDLVGEKLRGDPNGEVRAAANVLGLGAVLDSGPPPDITIVSAEVGHTSGSVSGDVAIVTARIADAGRGVGRIEWRVNGVTAAVTQPIGAGPVFTVSRQLALEPGDNVIEVSAYNHDNVLASRPARVTLPYVALDGANQRRLHVLAIGIDTYTGKGENEFRPLKLAAKDATALASALEAVATGDYAGVRIKLVLNEDATPSNLDAVIADMAGDMHSRDTFVLFAAAHGYSVDGRYYLIPADYQGTPDPTILAAKAIGQDRLQQWIAGLPARRSLILLDTCESGALVGGHSRSRLGSTAAEVGRLHEATGRPVLAAAAEGNPAYEGVIDSTGTRHGIFTWAILEALKHGDRNTNGHIELSELVAYAQANVPALAASAGGVGKTQSARFGSRGEDFALFARSP